MLLRVSIRSWFLSLTGERLSVWLDHDLLIHSPAGAHLAYFQLWAIMKKGAVDVGVKILVWACVFISLGYLGMGLQVVGCLYVFCYIL